ncbi:SDR family oxidoreductase [Candidatus Pacearchaeota archaeon]|nr:SDR family oxidoreductase [Candidatus Pacearchaeota archaeon]
MGNVVITGCSRGIGYATCRKFKQHKWYVIGVDIITEKNSCDAFFQCDLGNNEELKKEFTQISRNYNGIDALVNNAGVESSKKMMETTLEEWGYMFNVNLRAQFLTTKYLRENLKRAHGAIVNVSSIVGKQTSLESGVYATTKGAIGSMTRALALELAPEIRVNAVLPGAINTNMLLNMLRERTPDLDEKQLIESIEKKHPLGRIGTPSEVANLIYFLSTNNSSFITGQEFIIDGGVSAMLSSAF